jgi:hypothetical protein
MKSQPSEMFLGAILRGFDAEERSGKPVTCSGIWDQVCMECIHTPKGFITMFEWDERHPVGSKNRIATIADCIKAGMVHGLELYVGAVTRHGKNGREFVRRTGKGEV